MSNEAEEDQGCSDNIVEIVDRVLLAAAPAPSQVGTLRLYACWDKLNILHQTAVGVVLCRTREPYRVMAAVRDFAFAEKEPMDFKAWTILHGWATFDRLKPSDEPVCDNVAEPFAALKAINAVGGGNGNGFGNGVYCMIYPHPFLPKHPGMIQCVKEYARLFATGRKRLVLVTPIGFSLPVELEDDVVILDFDTPSYAEMDEIYDRLIEGIAEARRPRFKPEEKDRILSDGAGMTASEFENALSRALVTHRAKLPGVSIDLICEEVMKVKVEVVKRSEVLEIMEAESMASVGGLANLKIWVGKRAKCFGQEALDFGIQPPKGILLAGPPGTGTGQPTL